MAGILALRMVKALVRTRMVRRARERHQHHVLVKDGSPPITVPVKKGRTMKEGTARAILKQAGVSEDDFFEVY